MRKLITLALLAVAAACGDSTGPDTSYLGTYYLRTIDGTPTPVTMYESDGDYLRVTGGSLIFNDNQTYTTSLDFTYRLEGLVRNESYSTGGTFKREGSRFTLTDSDGDTYAATYDGKSTMTVTADGEVWVYQRS